MKRLFDENQILYGIMNLSDRIVKDYENKNPLFICVLKSASRFFFDLISMISNKIELDYDFIMVQSYDGKESTKEIKLICDIDKSIVYNREVVLVDDIHDTGLTIDWLIKHLMEYGAKNIKTCVLVNKFKNSKMDYEVFKVDKEFIIGYGMDYNGKYRGLPYIGVLDENNEG